MGGPHPDGLVIIRDVRGLRDGWPSSRWSCYYQGCTRVERWVTLIQMVLLLSGVYEG